MSQYCSPALEGNCPCYSEEISRAVQKFVTHFLLFLSAYRAVSLSVTLGFSLNPGRDTCCSNWEFKCFAAIHPGRTSL